MPGNKQKRSTIFKQRYQLLPSTATDDQRILEFDWHQGRSGHTQPKNVVLNATFP